MAEKVSVDLECLRATVDGQISAVVTLEFQFADGSQNIKHSKLVILESPHGWVFILCCLLPVNLPGLDQLLDVLLLQHLHGDPGQGRAGEALVQAGEDLLGEI